MNDTHYTVCSTQLHWEDPYAWNFAKSHCNHKHETVEDARKCEVDMVFEHEAAYRGYLRKFQVGAWDPDVIRGRQYRPLNQTEEKEA